MFEDTNKKVDVDKLSRTITNNLIRFILVGISFVYLFSGFFKPGVSDVPLWIRLADSTVSIVVAILISSMLGAQGMLAGNKSDSIINAKKAHADAIEKADKYAEYADIWSDEENRIAYKKARTHLLASAGLKYSDYFDDDGAYTDKEIEKPEGSIVKKSGKIKLSKEQRKQYKRRKKLLNRALYIRLSQVSYAGIATDSNVNYDYNNTGQTQTEFQTRRTFKKSIGKILSVAILGSIVFELAMGQNWMQALFNGAIKLVLFFAFGGWEYIINYNFVTIDYLSGLMKKTNLAKRLVTFGEQKRGEEYARQNSGTTKEISTTNERVSRVSSSDRIPSGSESSHGTIALERASE